MRGYLAWQKEGLGEPDEVRTATQEYRAEMDVLGAFLEDRCIIQPRAEAPATVLYNTYKAWCEEGGEAHETQRRFGARLRKRGFEVPSSAAAHTRGARAGAASALEPTTPTSDRLPG